MWGRPSHRVSINSFAIFSLLNSEGENFSLLRISPMLWENGGESAKLRLASAASIVVNRGFEAAFDSAFRNPRREH